LSRGKTALAICITCNRTFKVSPYRANTAQLPNAEERVLLDILVGAAPTFRYVGNQAFWIGPCASGQRRNPDFIDGSQKKAILLHGEYWHPKESVELEERDYMSKGWKVLVVWSKELRRKERTALLLRIRSFASQLS
jgi:G:T-mismatch repair DNA endonuclease (very short patch repair protein)